MRLAPMLLNELQQQRKEIAELKEVNESMQAAKTMLLTKDDRVAMQ